MNGGIFVTLLVDELKLKIEAVTKSQWKNKDDISLTVLKNAFRIFERQKFSQSILPITEFHELTLDHGHNIDSFAKRIDNKIIENKLRESESIGVYAFFDASGRVVYIGKTETNTLFSEMEQRYWHKKVNVKVLKKGKSHNLDSSINDITRYISAYRVEKYLIGNVEALLTRVIINNASNIRIERFHKPSI